MKDYLSFWRLIPRISVGLVFSVVLILAISGPNGMVLIAKTEQQFYSGFQSEIVALIVSAFLLAIISTLGSQLSRFLSAMLSAIFGKVRGLFITNNSPNNSFLNDLVAPISNIVERTYRAHHEFFMKHYMLKSAGDEKLNQVKAITSHFDRVRQHADSVQDWDIICVQAYQESLSQDQRKFENMEEDLALIGSLNAVLLFASPVVAIRIWEMGSVLAVSSGILLLLFGIAGVPAYVNLKRRVARLLLASYLDVFTVSKMTEYSEREGEPKI
jgi:hypothetical protein